jgi:hypothetical protein
MDKKDSGACRNSVFNHGGSGVQRTADRTPRGFSFHNQADFPRIKFLSETGWGELLHFLYEGTHMHTGSWTPVVKIAFITQSNNNYLKYSENGISVHAQDHRTDQ